MKVLVEWLNPEKTGLYFDSSDLTGQQFKGNLDNFFTAENEWVHITWVKAGKEYKFYRNGELFATKPAPETFYHNQESKYYMATKAETST
ncbi:hypothetical protein ACE1CI_05630 [Aerosakkonemataceae cyanobacterium BLCC-F50]|uniref:Uncharacterized protein n=1 Tax=Floridaenema flaviceps BLCC-F50 TaxID=3153642 RepID=A0ABV4XL44_9CYAN